MQLCVRDSLFVDADARRLRWDEGLQPANEGQRERRILDALAESGYPSHRGVFVRRQNFDRRLSARAFLRSLWVPTTFGDGPGAHAPAGADGLGEARALAMVER